MKMARQNKNIFTLTSEDGETKEYEVILTIESPEFNKNYIVYTDYSLDENGNYKTYASIYDASGEDLNLTPVTSSEEWEMIENVLNSAQKNVLRDKKNDEEKNE